MIAAQSARRVLVVAALTIALLAAEPMWSQGAQPTVEYFASLLPQQGEVVGL